MAVFQIVTPIYMHPLLSQMPLTQRLNINTEQIGAVQAKALKYTDMEFAKNVYYWGIYGVNDKP